MQGQLCTQGERVGKASSQGPTRTHLVVRPCRRFTGSSNPTRVKLRWDDTFLYVAAELRSRLGSMVSVQPYFDDDFEVFIDASQSNYFYVEFEMNARSQTLKYFTTNAGISRYHHITPVQRQTNTRDSKSLCDHDVEREGEEHGGLLNQPAEQRLPGVPVEPRAEWVERFANALHAPWWSKLTAADTKHPELIKQRCEEEIRTDKERYMHNPDVFGYLQFADEASASGCRNVFWLSRFILAQLYQAEADL
eukprot:Skav234074  [mRNA]  locus=scaffold2565:105004:109097:+ [translate_table: standard]